MCFTNFYRFCLGGSFIQSIKHQNPKLLKNSAGIYITCNNIPNFKTEQENIERRLSIFHTKTMPVLHAEAPKWIENHAMECLVWLINEINRNIELVDKHERFYEK